MALPLARLYQVQRAAENGMHGDRRATAAQAYVLSSTPDSWPTYLQKLGLSEDGAQPEQVGMTEAEVMEKADAVLQSMRDHPERWRELPIS